LGFGRHPCWMAWCEHRAVGGGGPQHPELIFGWEAIMQTLIQIGDRSVCSAGRDGDAGWLALP
jgi:hypothetical protein